MSVTPAKRLVDQVLAHAASPDSASRLALRSEAGQSVSYARLAEAVTQDDSTHDGVEFLISSQTIGFVITYLRLAFRGISVAVIPESITTRRFGELVTAYDPQRVWGLAPQLAGFGLEVDSVADFDMTWAQRTPVNAVSQTYRGQLLLLTSGSTGAPRTVRISQHAIATNTEDIVHALALAPEEVALTTLPLSYTFGLSVLQTHLFAGATVVCSSAGPLDWSFRSLMGEFGVTSLSGVPLSFSMFERSKIVSDPPHRLRRLLQAGGRMQATQVHRVARTLQRSGRELVVMYGQTEATARISIMPPELVGEYPEAVGYSVASGRIEIGSERAPDEVVFHGPNVMLGYASCLEDLGLGDQLNGTLRTGDLGSLSAGLLRIHGRLRRIIKLNGVRTSLDDIECQLNRLCEVAVVGRDDLVTVYFVPNDQVRAEEVEAELTEALGLRKRDFKTVVLESLAYLPSGKLDYQQLEPL